MDQQDTRVDRLGRPDHLGPLPSGPYSVMADVELISWAQHDDAAFAELFSRHASNVRRRALQRTGSPEVADLIVTATAMRARRTIGASLAGRDVRRWILDTTENECIGWFERGRTATDTAPTAEIMTVRMVEPTTSADGRDGLRWSLGRMGARALAGVRAAGQPDRLI